MKRFGLINAVLLALIALATWRTVEVWRRSPPERDLPAEAPARPGGDGLPAPPRKPLLPQLVATIADKDLFDASRKAAEAEAPTTAPTPAPPPPTLKLAGVIVVGVQREVLLLDSTQSNKKLRMREGEEVSGFTIGRILPEQVSLIGTAGEEIVLPLEIEKGQGPKKGGFGPGGKPTPQTATGKPGGPLQAKGPAPGAPQPIDPQLGRKRAGGAVMPNNAGAAAAQAQSAKERLRRLRAEAAR